MRKCNIYITDSLQPILVMGYISHHIGKKWTIVKGTYYTYIIKTDSIYEISIPVESEDNE